MQTLTRLSNAANRVYEAMQTLAHATRTGVTIKEIMHTSGMGYSSVCGALNELQRNRIISKHSAPKRAGLSYVYSFENLDYLDNPDNPDFQKAALGTCTPPVWASRAPAFDDLNLKNDDDDAHAEKFQRICAALSEYGIAKSSATAIANEFAAQPDSDLNTILDCIRSICTQTKSEPVWRNPIAVSVVRLRAAAKKQPDPLPLFPQLPAQPKPAPAQRLAGRPAYAKKAGSYRRPQVESSEADREADEAAAAKIRAELRARRTKTEVTA